MSVRRFTPSYDRETAEVVKQAAADSQTLEIISGGSKRNLGRPVKASAVVDVSVLSGVIEYQPEELVLGTGRRGQDFYDKPDGELLHLTNWVECVRSRQKPHCPAEAGVGAASAAHLGNQAYRGGGVAKWKG